MSDQPVIRVFGQSNQLMRVKLGIVSYIFLIIGRSCRQRSYVLSGTLSRRVHNRCCIFCVCPTFPHQLRTDASVNPIKENIKIFQYTRLTFRNNVNLVRYPYPQNKCMPHNRTSGIHKSSACPSVVRPCHSHSGPQRPQCQFMSLFWCFWHHCG